MWRKKKEVPQQTNSVVQKTVQVPFTPDHPMLAMMKKVDACSFLETEQPSAFAKLTLWLKEHPNTIGKLVFNIYEQQVNEEFLSFKQNALKTQILEGIQLIQKMETTVKELDIVSQSQMKAFPFPEVKQNYSAQKLWHSIRENDIKTQLLKREFNKLINEFIKKNKITVANLVSLLASIDAIPVNYVPVVDLKSMDVPNDFIAQTIPMCSLITKKIVELQEQTSRNFTLLSDTAKLFGDTTADDWLQIQITFFNDTLHTFLPSFDQQTHCISQGADFDKFHDFIFHPSNPIYDISKKFIDEPDKESYWHLVHAIIETFKVDQNDILLVASVCSACIATFAIPDIKYDGLGTEKDEETQNAICLLAMTDPMQCMIYINSIGTRNAAIALQSVTSAWKSVLSFIYDFTNDEIIAQELIGVRSSIGEIVAN